MLSWPVERLHSRLIVPYNREHSRITSIFGITSYSPAVRVEADVEKIQKATVELVQSKTGTFKVETQRSDKRFPLKSPELNRIIGQCVEEQTSLTFDFKKPQTILGIEIHEKGVFLFTETFKCRGGLPTGVEGKALAFIEDDASVLAGILFMKRGVQVLPVALGERDISLLQKYSPKKLELKVLKDVAAIEKYAMEQKIDAIVSKKKFENLVSFNPLAAIDLKEKSEIFK